MTRDLSRIIPSIRCAVWKMEFRNNCDARGELAGKYVHVDVFSQIRAKMQGWSENRGYDWIYKTTYHHNQAQSGRQHSSGWRAAYPTTFTPNRQSYTLVKRTPWVESWKRCSEVGPWRPHIGLFSPLLTPIFPRAFAQCFQRPTLCYFRVLWHRLHSPVWITATFTRLHSRRVVLCLVMVYVRGAIKK